MSGFGLPQLLVALTVVIMIFGTRRFTLYRFPATYDAGPHCLARAAGRRHFCLAPGESPFNLKSHTGQLRGMLWSHVGFVNNIAQSVKNFAEGLGTQPGPRSNTRMEPARLTVPCDHVATS